MDALYKQYKERQKKKGRSVGEGSSKGRDKRATLEDEDDGDLGSDDVNNSDGSDSEETRFGEDDANNPLEWENNANEEDEEMNPKKRSTRTRTISSLNLTRAK